MKRASKSDQQVPQAGRLSHMTFNAKLSVSDGLDHLAERLDPIIAAKFASDLAGHPWTVVLTHLDEVAGKPAKYYSAVDLQTQLKMFTRRLGNLGFPFDDQRQTVGTLGRELTIVRNARAHGDPFDVLDAWRAHDYCVRLLEHFGDAPGLIRANELRQEALLAYIDEQGIAPVPVSVDGGLEAESLGTESDSSAQDDEQELVTPDAEVFTRPPTNEPSFIGNSRMPFEPWVPVPIGDVSILDALPRVAAKQKVRAVAVEIVEAEGPIHLDRLGQLVAASFGVRKLHSTRAAQIMRQAKATGLLVDKDKFVWPDGVTPKDWNEFRPNTSQTDRPFLHISPVEIANAMRFLTHLPPAQRATDLDTVTLQTFGRKRRTKQFSAHLTKAKSLLGPN